MNAHRIASLALVLLLGLAFLSGTAWGSELDEVLEASRSATGTTDNTLLKVLVADASCSGPDGEFETKTSSAPKGNFWMRQKHPGQPPYAAMITPEGQWRVHKDGTRTPLEPNVYLMVRSHDFQRIALDPGSFAIELSSAGLEDFDGVGCRKIQGLVGDGTTIDFYFVKKSGLPRGFRMDNPLDPGKPVTIIFREWRTVDGVQLPSVVVALDTQGEFVLDFHTIYFEEVLTPEE